MSNKLLLILEPIRSSCICS